MAIVKDRSLKLISPFMQERGGKSPNADVVPRLSQSSSSQKCIYLKPEFK